MLAGGEIKVGKPARELAAYILEGLPIPVLGRFLKWYGQLPVAGLLPPSLRQAYGFKWGRREEITLRATAWVYRHLHPFLPLPLRRWKIARQAG